MALCLCVYQVDGCLSLSLTQYFCPSQTQAHLSALFAWNTGRYRGECSFTQVWLNFAHPATSLLFLKEKESKVKKRKSNFVRQVTTCVSLLFTFQMSNPVGFTQTKELQEDPLHKEHKATRYAQWKVRRRNESVSLLGTSAGQIIAGRPSQWSARQMFLISPLAGRRPLRVAASSACHVIDWKSCPLTKLFKWFLQLIFLSWSPVYWSHHEINHKKKALIPHHCVTVHIGMTSWAHKAVFKCFFFFFSFSLLGEV